MAEPTPGRYGTLMSCGKIVPSDCNGNPQLPENSLFERMNKQRCLGRQYRHPPDSNRSAPNMLLIVCRLIVFMEISLSMNKIVYTFGRNLRGFRQAAGLSQEELAHLAGLHRTYVGAVERGERNISIRNVEKLANALKVEPAAFFAEARGKK
jgi:DNA-binding XRE family transcriptional regulator